MTIFEVVRREVTARQAAELYGLRIDSHGRGFCPWHDDGRHAALQFFPDGGCYCHSCHANGDAIALAAKVLNLSPKKAAHRLYKDFGLRQYVESATDDQRRVYKKRLSAKEMRKKAAERAVKDAEEELDMAVTLAVRLYGTDWFGDAMQVAKKSYQWLLLKRCENEYGPFAIEEHVEQAKEQHERYSYLCDVVREADAKLAMYTPDTIDATFDLLLDVRSKADQELNLLWEDIKSERA